MRMLNSAEMMVVAGGDGALPPCPPCPPAGCPWGDDVVIPGRPLPSRRSPNATTGAFDPIVISGSINLQLFALSWQAEMDAEALLRMEAGRPGVIDVGGGEDGVIGYPVDLDPSSIKDAVDYAKDWKAVFDKMSPAELKAFDAQLDRDYKNAFDKLAFGLAGFLHEFSEANGNSDKMGAASSRAAQNASPVTLGLIEAALTRAYAVAAALPGGI